MNQNDKIDPAEETRDSEDGGALPEEGETLASEGANDNGAAADAGASDDAGDGASDDAGSDDGDRSPGAGPGDEIAEMKDRLLRALAEAENVRRRAERQVTESRAYAITNFARDLLVVSDNLRRALDALPEASSEARDGLGADVKAFVDGVEMTERELLTALERHGVRKIVPMGEKFDHNLHQAMFEVNDTDAAPGTIVQVAQPGYVLNDRLLRPAMVGVAKARPENIKGVDETV